VNERDAAFPMSPGWNVGVLPPRRERKNRRAGEIETPTAILGKLSRSTKSHIAFLGARRDHDAWCQHKWRGRQDFSSAFKLSLRRAHRLPRGLLLDCQADHFENAGFNQPMPDPKNRWRGHLLPREALTRQVEGKLRSCGVPWPGRHRALFSTVRAIPGADGRRSARFFFSRSRGLRDEGYWGNRPEATEEAHSAAPASFTLAIAGYFDETGCSTYHDRVDRHDSCPAAEELCTRPESRTPLSAPLAWPMSR